MEETSPIDDGHITEKELKIMRLHFTRMLYEREMGGMQADIVCKYVPEHMATLIEAQLRVASEQLQDIVLTTIPANLWQWARWALGLPYRRTKLVLQEYLLYPTIPVHNAYRDTIRVYERHGIEEDIATRR